MFCSLLYFRIVSLILCFYMSLYVAAAAFYVLYKVLELFPRTVRTPFSIGKRAHVQRIAHRGSRGEGLPENTKAAFVDACNAGAEVLEV